MRSPPFQVMLFLLVVALLFALNRLATQSSVGEDSGVSHLPVSTETTAWPHEAVPEGMVELSGGEFIFGSSQEQKKLGYDLDRRFSASEEPASVAEKWYSNEPEARVEKTGPLAIDETPVTNAEFQEFVARFPSAQPSVSPETWKQQNLAHPWERVQKYLWSERKPPEGRGEHPVVLADWATAALYCQWRERRYTSRHPEGPALDFRLPTGLEYERSARGRMGRAFPWGKTYRPGVTNVIYHQGGERKGPLDTAPVGEFPEDVTEEGVRHTGGMVFEWTATPWGSENVWQPAENYSPGETDPALDRVAGVLESGEFDFTDMHSRLAEHGASRHEVRGASFDDLPGMARTTVRHSRPSGIKHILIGFRCAAVPGEEGENGSDSGPAADSGTEEKPAQENTGETESGSDPAETGGSGKSEEPEADADDGGGEEKSRSDE